MQTLSHPEARTPDGDAERLHRALTELVRRYQLSDRREICCHGVTVAQSHALAACAAVHGSTMGQVATRLGVAVSTATRLVDQLVERGLLRREVDPDDRRVWRVWPTAEGEHRSTIIRSELLAREQEVLEGFPAAHRESVMAALERLAEAVDRWRHSGDREAREECCND